MKFPSFSTLMVVSSGEAYLTRCGDRGVPLHRGTVFLKRAQLSASIFRICAELWVLIEETCRVMGTF